MTPQELQAFLGRSVQRRTIAPSRAAELLKKPPSSALLPHPSPIRPLDRKAVLDSLGGRWPGSETLARRSPSLAERAKFRDRLTAQYEKQVTGLAKSLTSGKITLPQWHDAMIKATTTNMIRQTMIGRGGGIPQTSEIPGLDRRIQTQHAFLQRFAEQMAARAIDGKLVGMSSGGVEQRAKMYGGAAHEEWWRAATAKATRVRYIAKDDHHTCGPCLNAEGEYDAKAEHPYPGSVCLGRSHCRCKLEIIE